jgi:hypothetical protein
MGELSLDRIDRPHKVYRDKTLICLACNKYFIHSVNAQFTYDRLHFTDPKRCRECVKANRYSDDYKKVK